MPTLVKPSWVTSQGRNFPVHVKHSAPSEPKMFSCEGPPLGVAISGLMVKVKSARFYRSGQQLKFSQDPYRVHITGLPAGAPDSPLTTIAIECDGEPKQDTIFVRNNKPREGV